jgi:hypothetical protein
VWALIGPGLAEPGHIELDSRTVYLDSDELLGRRQDILTGRLERIRVLTTIGVGLHEVMHAKHTKLWVMERDLALADSEDPVSSPRTAGCSRSRAWRRRAAARSRTRRRAGGSSAAPWRRRSSTASCRATSNRRSARRRLAGRPVTRDMAGRAMTYLHARTRYGVIDAGARAPLAPVWHGVLGAADLKSLEDLCARVVWLADGDNARSTAPPRSTGRSSVRLTHRRPTSTRARGPRAAVGRAAPRRRPR